MRFIIGITTVVLLVSNIAAGDVVNEWIDSAGDSNIDLLMNDEPFIDSGNKVTDLNAVTQVTSTEAAVQAKSHKVHEARYVYGASDITFKQTGQQTKWNDSSLNVVPSDADATGSSSDGYRGKWFYGHLSRAIMDPMGDSGTLHTSITGIRFGYRPLNESYHDNYAFLDWIEFVDATGKTVSNLVQRDLEFFNTSSEFIHDTTDPNDKFYTPNFVMTGFQLRRFPIPLPKLNYEGPNPYRLDVPNFFGPDKKRPLGTHYYGGIVDVRFFGYTLVGKSYPYTNVTTVQRIPKTIGKFFESTDLDLRIDNSLGYKIHYYQWGPEYKCPPGEHVVGYATRNDLKNKDKSDRDWSGLTGMRIVCYNQPVITLSYKNHKTIE